MACSEFLNSICKQTSSETVIKVLSEFKRLYYYTFNCLHRLTLNSSYVNCSPTLLNMFANLFMLFF